MNDQTDDPPVTINGIALTVPEVHTLRAALDYFRRMVSAPPIGATLAAGYDRHAAHIEALLSRCP